MRLLGIYPEAEMAPTASDQLKDTNQFWRLYSMNTMVLVFPFNVQHRIPIVNTQIRMPHYILPSTDTLWSISFDSNRYQSCSLTADFLQVAMFESRVAGQTRRVCIWRC